MWVFTPNIDRCPTPSGPGPLGRAAGRAAGPLGQKGMVFFGVSGVPLGSNDFLPYSSSQIELYTTLHMTFTAWLN